MEPSAVQARLAFDRGTIVLTETPADVDVTSLPGLLWDPRVRCFRAPAWRHRELARALAGVGLEVKDDVRDTGDPPGRWAAPELRTYQRAALQAWEAAGRRGIVVLPTGSGKTRLAIAVMAATGLRTLCLVPTRVLLEQWQREIAAAYPHRVGCFGDGARELAPITVATFESAYRHMDRLGNRFELLIVDEAHHFGSGSRDEALEMSIAHARLGLTATPRTDDAAVEQLTHLIGPVVFELSIGDLAGRFLAELDLVTLPLDLTPGERVLYERLLSAFREVHQAFTRAAPSSTWRDFMVAAARTAEGRRAVSAWRRARELLAYTEAKREAVALLLDRHRDARTLVFTADNETAYTIARTHLVMPLTCDIGRKERDAALEAFRHGALRALVSARVLNEGIDVPDADVGIVVGAALGGREHVQRVGRLLRPREGKRALVYELITRDTIEVRQAQRRREDLAPRIAAPL